MDALALVTAQDVAGTFNVAADDMVTLSQALRMMGRPTFGVPQPLAPIVATIGPRVSAWMRPTSWCGWPDDAFDD